MKAKLKKPWKRIEKLLNAAAAAPLDRREAILEELREYSAGHGLTRDKIAFEVMDAPTAEIIPFPGGRAQ